MTTGRSNIIDREMETYLDDLERQIEPWSESDIFEQWKDFFEGRFDEDVFTPVRRIKKNPAVEWPSVTMNEAMDDFQVMALQQYGTVSQRICDPEMSLAVGVRCNYGSSVLPSLFGAEMFYMDDKLNTLPTSRPLSGGMESIKKLIDKGVPDIYGGLGGKVFAMAEVFKEINSR
ncbi:MAG: hypothetical protein PHT33_13185, partial [bacterium]|nr:hypothetical protein [bacterium]